jgi:hypothetical protein
LQFVDIVDIADRDAAVSTQRGGKFVPITVLRLSQA